MTILLAALLYPTFGAMVVLGVLVARSRTKESPVRTILYGLAAWWLFMIGALGIVALTGLLTGWL